MTFLDRHLENLAPFFGSSIYTMILSCLSGCQDTLLLTSQKSLMFSFETAFHCQDKVSGWIHTL